VSNNKRIKPRKKGPLLVSRRRFLQVLIAGVIVVIFLRNGIQDGIRSLINRLRKDNRGFLDKEVLQVLMSVTKTILGSSIELSHYQDYFVWHAENLPGYKGLYREFAANLNRRAKRLHGQAFVRCDQVQREDVLNRLFSGAAFQKYPVIQELMQLYSKTDAWIQLGYNAWPGTARGLDRYTKPLRKQAWGFKKVVTV